MTAPGGFWGTTLKLLVNRPHVISFRDFFRAEADGGNRWHARSDSNYLRSADR